VSLSTEQLEMRRKGIGASESPCLVGVSPFGGPIGVWAKKMGLFTERPTDAMDLGNYLEEGILRMYADKTKRQIMGFGTVTHPKHPWMLCTPDGAAFGERRIVQVKLVGSWMASHWEEGVPDYVEVQVQHEMEVCDVPVCDVVAVLGGTEYRCIEVKRDRSVGRDLVEICHAFWKDHVLTGEMPEPDGGEEARATIGARWKHRDEKMIAATPELERLGIAWLVEDEKIRAAEKAQSLIEQKLKIAIGEHEGIEGESFRATWKENKAKKRVFLLKEAGNRKVMAA